MHVYLDESGDLGWKFDRPYRAGGSSRFLTLAFLIVPKTKAHLPRKLVRKIYQKRRQPSGIEIKGSSLTVEEKIFFSKGVEKLITAHPDVSITAITVKKENVQQHIRVDPNKLYNYMTNLGLLKKIKEYPIVEFIRDKRSIKVESGNSLSDYLQTQLWFELNAATIIRDQPFESHRSLNLQFADIVANIVWKKFEDNESSAYNILRKNITLHFLFF